MGDVTIAEWARMVNSRRVKNSRNTLIKGSVENFRSASPLGSVREELVRKLGEVTAPRFPRFSTLRRREIIESCASYDLRRWL